MARLWNHLLHALLLQVIPLFGVIFCGCNHSPQPDAESVTKPVLSVAQTTAVRQAIPQPAPRADFVTSAACRKCHQEEHSSWHTTYHRTMTQVASPDTIQAAFDGTTLYSYNQPFTFEREGDTFYVRMIDPAWQVEMLDAGKDPWQFQDGPLSRQPVEMVTGSHNVQYYWVEGHQEQQPIRIPVAYLIRDQRLIPVQDAFLTPPEREHNPPTYYWDHRFGIWNRLCSMCHSVGAKPGMDMVTKSLHTEVAEFGISCESCHGPGKAHVEFHESHPDGYRTESVAEGIKLFSPHDADTDVSSQMCGRCHNIADTKNLVEYAMHGMQFQPGDDLDDWFTTLHFDASQKDEAWSKKTYWPDGTQRVSSCEFVGTSASTCYQEGKLSCLSCHTMHEGDPKDMLTTAMRGNEACLQCHEQFRDDVAAHTHHPADSAASLCYNCHMPRSAYGFLAAQHTHRIDSPRVEASAQNKPNACNLCHLDQTLAWTAEHLTTWYGQDPVELSEDDRTLAAGPIWLLRGDAVQRAVTAWHAGWSVAQETCGVDWQAPLLAQQLDDRYSAVRYVAQDAIKRLPGFDGLTYDFIAPSEERKLAEKWVVDRWLEQGNAPPAESPQLLIHQDGTLMVDEIRRLLTEQDQAPLQLFE